MPAKSKTPSKKVRSPSSSPSSSFEEKKKTTTKKRGSTSPSSDAKPPLRSVKSSQKKKPVSSSGSSSDSEVVKVRTPPSDVKSTKRGAQVKSSSETPDKLPPKKWVGKKKAVTPSDIDSDSEEEKKPPKQKGKEENESIRKNLGISMAAKKKESSSVSDETEEESDSSTESDEEPESKKKSSSKPLESKTKFGNKSRMPKAKSSNPSEPNSDDSQISNVRDRNVQEYHSDSEIEVKQYEGKDKITKLPSDIISLIAKMLGGEDSLSLMRSSGLYNLTASKLDLDLSNTPIKLSKLNEMTRELSLFKSLSLNIIADNKGGNIDPLLGKITSLILAGELDCLYRFKKSPLKSLELEHNKVHLITEILRDFPSLERLLINNTTWVKKFTGKIPNLTTPSKLKYLDVESVHREDDQIFESSLPDLETLIIRDEPGSIPFKNKLYGCKKLKVLELHCKVIPDVISDISRFKNLERFISTSDGYGSIHFNGNFSIKSPTIKYIQLSNIVSNLYDFSGCTNLEKLYLNRVGYNNTAVLLKGCTKLRELEIHIHDLQDLSFLSECPQLKTLVVKISQLDNIEGIDSCTELELLDISSSAAVVDISLLSGLTKLKKLNLSGTHISDISPLSSCTELVILNLEAADVKNLSPISNCTKLEKLNLNNTNITSLKPLTNMTSLTHIYLSNTYITNLNKAAKWTNLVSIHANGCDQLTSIKGLSNCEKLKYANFSGTKIVTLQGLERCRSLVRLDCDDCENLRDITALFNHTNLRKLTVRGSSIRSISSLSNCTGLTSLTLRNNKKLVDSEKTISKMKNLTRYRGKAKIIGIGMGERDSNHDDYDED